MKRFKNLRRSLQAAIVFAVILSIGIAAYAVTLLWNSAHKKAPIEVDDWVEVGISIGNVSELSVRPGGSVSLSPVLTNNGDIDCAAFIKVVMPAVSSVGAYEFESSSDWTKVDETVDGDEDVQIWAYGGDELGTVEPGASTSALTGSFTMLSTITGAELKAMDSVDIDVYGYLVDKTAGTDPETVWGMIPEN